MTFSFEPEHDAGELDEAEEGCCELIVACCDAAPLLEFGEEALNSPALAVGDPIIAVLMLAMTARRNDRLAALIQDGVVEAVGIVGAVGDDLA